MGCTACYTSWNKRHYSTSRQQSHSLRNTDISIDLNPTIGRINIVHSNRSPSGHQSSDGHCLSFKNQQRSGTFKAIYYGEPLKLHFLAPAGLESIRTSAKAREKCTITSVNGHNTIYFQTGFASHRTQSLHIRPTRHQMI